ncbi:NACHT domain-containing NTPase [Pseudomonas sp. B21-021]|uniref:NACHT domain-containing protein n=1 Tax=Pseudomonas sp. B21-021 TaxID=2895476 RepID=UPI00215E8F05|nr:hypothetical protein [Pseudomonas sp. B21-021]UVM25022.1 hypothetical protein LOY31_16390 [Pseudomonas sp. B21-021]
MNGIWMCQSCSKLIDSDDSRFTVALLHEWKSKAIQRALDAIAGGESLGSVRPADLLDDADQDFLRGLNLPTVEALDVVGGKLRAATLVDIQGFRAVPGQPARTIALTLRLEGSSRPQVTIESFARVVSLAEPVGFVAVGGTGKSTTLLQLAECMGNQEGLVPLLVPLGEWSDRQDDFFDFVLRRNAFYGFRREHLMQLAYHGNLALLLDGWNELPADARLRATRDLAALQRDYPQIGIVVSSRRQALPDVRPIIVIDPLSDEQQLEIAQAVRGDEGVGFVDRAWRTPGVRELVSNPLYLNALLTLPSGAKFPVTKEAVLRMFVQQNESAPEKVERLQRDGVGEHNAFLIGLAVEATGGANTIVANTSANRIISDVTKCLIAAGQIGSAPQPRAIVDGLVAAHLLVRSTGIDGAVSFQHQLFQDWYASLEVERVMLEASAGDADALKILREQMLNWPSWEDSVLFACDRVSRDGEEGVRSVSVAINEALEIDPILAAVMLERADDLVWREVRNRVLTFIERWHSPGELDRAVRFMVTSGKPDFAHAIWPFVSNTKRQIQFGLFRLVDRFHPSVLGVDCALHLGELPAAQRLIAFPEIASNSGFDGLELAVELAASDPDPDVVAAVVTALAFRRADRHVNLILETASDAVWEVIAHAGFPDHLTDVQLDARLIAQRGTVRNADTTPGQLLDWILRENPEDAEFQITQLIGTVEFEPNGSGIEHAVMTSFSVYPLAVASGLVARITADLPLPYHIEDYLNQAPLIDSGPVADAAIDPLTSERRLNAAAAVIGPVTIAVLFDQLFVIDSQVEVLGRYDEELSKAHHRLVGALSGTRQNVFAQVLVSKSEETNYRRIGLLADVLARHGRAGGDTKLPFDEDTRSNLSRAVGTWMETLLAAPQLPRNVASDVARAAERVADAELAELLRTLIERDLVEYEIARSGWLQTGGRGGVIPMGHSLMYSRALAAMHDAPAVAVLIRGLSDLRWGKEAAGALLEIWQSDNFAPKKPTFNRWTDYSHHLIRRAERVTQSPLTSDFAEAIFVVAADFGVPSKSDAEQKHALALGGVGLALPHGSKRQEIDLLLSLPQPTACKHRLLANAARAGEVIPSAILMEGLRELLSEAQEQRWRLENNRGELMGWIDLFPFSDSPERVHEAILLLSDQHRSPNALQRLLETIPQSPADTAFVMLERLAAENPAFFGDSQWTSAMLRLNTLEAVVAVLEHLSEGRIPAGDGFHLSSELTRLAILLPDFHTILITRYLSLPPGNIRRVLEMAMNDLPGEENFMALFEGSIQASNPFQHLGRALRNLAISRRPSEQWSGAFEEFGLPLIEIRARLFTMFLANDAQSELAKQCLLAIEEYRDEKGRLNNEPRHPDISTGRAWPPEAEAGFL